MTHPDLTRLHLDLDRLLTDLAGQDRFSGVVLVARGGDTRFPHAYGLANRADGEPNQTDTRFGTASITKMFTAVAVAQLVERGDLSFETRVRDCLPVVPKHMAAGVTVHHLLTHTSGIGDYFDEETLGAAAYERVWDE